MAVNQYSQSRPGAPPTLTRGELRASTQKAQADLKRGQPDLNYGLGVCKVVNIDYTAFLVTLRTVLGTSKVFERIPVPLTFPGAGARHFFGALPEIGDYCVVGWAPQESTDPAGGTKHPIILSWVVPGMLAGQEWLTLSETEADEHEMGPGERAYYAGAYDRIRHKLRHMRPGNIVASSSQGSDLVLDEGVTLANRRGNEIRLRDQDQAFIVRSVQQVHAMAGARIYAGMVQRDATFLPAMMVSDGKLWDGGRQSTAKVPVHAANLPPDTNPPGFLTPAKTLQRAPQSAGGVGRDLLGEEEYLDPYIFLRQGGFINDDGFATDDKYRASASYGGKSIYRVMSQNSKNATTQANAPTLTEYRLEITHTSDGQLPVTEQTDGFDADRLPEKDQTQASKGLPRNAPFIEWVMGSVVGNDPFTPEGRKKYGLPLVATIFDEGAPNPRLEPAVIASEGSGVTPTPLKDQLATLFRMTPPVGEGDSTGSFWGLNKQGQMRAYLGGDPTGNSLEAWLAGGLKLGLGGRFEFLNNGGLSLGTKGKNSFQLTSEDGGVRIYGGGPLQSEEGLIESSLGTGRGASDVPSLELEAKTNMRLKAERQILAKAGEFIVNANKTRLMGHESMELQARRTAVTTDTLYQSVSAKAVETYMGPQYAMPSNFPLHERVYAPTIPGVAERVRYGLGASREEIFEAGSHSTHVRIGDMSYKLDAGKWKAEAVTASLEMGVNGIDGRARTGNVSLRAEAGAVSMSGLTAAELVAQAGTATVRGLTGVNLSSPGASTDIGPVLAAGTREPFTNLPFATWGLGNPKILLTP